MNRSGSGKVRSACARPYRSFCGRRLAQRIDALVERVDLLAERVEPGSGAAAAVLERVDPVGELVDLLVDRP